MANGSAISAVKLFSSCRFGLHLFVGPPRNRLIWLVSEDNVKVTCKASLKNRILYNIVLPEYHAVIIVGHEHCKLKIKFQ